MNAPPKHDPPEAAPPAESPPKGKGGPPLGSQNAFRHGMKAGKLPKGMAYIEKRTNLYRLELEGAVLDVKGSISVADAAAINTACKWERHAMLALHWIRKDSEKDVPTLSANDHLRFSEAIAKASDARDRNIRLLGLDAKAPAPWLLPAPKVTDIED